ncbi:hypothetical protein BJX61DRAFT_124237 [Aspergillus egyptiacus]|nr:hypothetical protein BJX61DRAFT_124237 [Aspergillus egyptiacus]
MYGTMPLDISYMNQQLPQRYESEEEDVSEAETGHAFSPIQSSETLTDSDISPGEPSRPLPRLLSPFPSTKGSRPVSMVSMDTVKRSSTATFVTDPYTIFDHDDDMIIELPSPETTASSQSPIFLQPTVYVPSERFASSRNSFRSGSSVSLDSDDESDVCVAEQVTYVEPLAKPNLILISPTEQSPREPVSPGSSEGSVYSCDEATKSQPALSQTKPDQEARHPARPTHGKAQASLSALDTLLQHGTARPSEPMSASTVEAPRSLPFRTHSMSFSRPQTPVTERNRLRKEIPRPPSAQSTATFSLFPHSTYSAEEARVRSLSCSQPTAISDFSASSPTSSRTASPSPFFSPAYNRSRSGSLYSVSSTGTPGKRPPLFYRGSFIKGSGIPGGYSSSSLRSELDSSPIEEPSDEEEGKPKTKHKKSFKQLRSSISKTETAESPTKSFVGFMLRGKRKSVIKNA